MGKGLNKEESAALKGVAILIMIAIHCLRSEVLMQKYGIVFRGITKEQMFGFVPYGKICVSLFAFVSGFGLMAAYSSRKQEASKWTAAHLLKLLSGFWFISVTAYIVYFALGKGHLLRWGKNAFQQILAILVDGLGFSELLGTKSLNGTWWYMSAAAVYILLVPLLAELMEKYGGLVCMGLVIAVPRMLGVRYQGGNAVLTFLPTVTFGMVCCKYNILERCRELKITGNGLPDDIIKFTALAVLILLGKRSFGLVSTSTYMEYKFVVIPFFVILFCVEFLFRIKWLRRFLGYLGKHSMNIWLTHTFVRDWMRDIVYSFREAWAVVLAVLGISLALSYALDFLKKATGYDALIQKQLNKLK